jgi:hypothetical protein
VEVEYQATVKAATEEANRVRDESIKKTIDAAEAKRQELLKAIADAKGPGGGNAIDEAKKGIGQDATLKQIQKSRGDKAEQELRDKLKASGELDQNGKAIDEDPAERARKQRSMSRFAGHAERLEQGLIVMRGLERSETVKSIRLRRTC